MSEVRTKLNGADIALRCTLGAAIEINSSFGSFVEAWKQIQNFNLSAYFVVVAAGLGKKVKDVQSDVFATGCPDLVKPLGDYLNRLSNGGRPIEEDKPGEGAKTGEG